jgi:hypothetical protein
MQKLALSKAIDFIPRTRIFSATFTKQDGSTRVMVARRGVQRAKGTGTYSHTRDTRRNNLSVRDMQAGAYRAIPLDRTSKLRIDGIDYEIV